MAGTGSYVTLIVYVAYFIAGVASKFSGTEIDVTQATHGVAPYVALVSNMLMMLGTFRRGDLTAGIMRNTDSATSNQNTLG